MSRQYYEAYDDRYRQVHDAGLQWFADNPTGIVRETIARFGINRNKKFLEIGCGEGRDAYPLLREGYNLLATDISEEVIRYNRERWPEFSNSFAVMDCISGEMTEQFDFIYAVAVIHMLVEEVHRNAFYSFIREHLMPDGIGLICTMGDGTIERQSDIRNAFQKQDRVHEQTGKPVKIASTSCRMVSFDTFHKELDRNGLAVLEEGITEALPDFSVLMYAIVKGEKNMIYDTIVTREPIEKGWSGDKKYCVATEDGNKYLLRITSPERVHRFWLCYQQMQEAARLDIPICLPVEFGKSPEGTYALHSWIDGVDAEAVIPGLSNEHQYAYGLDAGRILKKLHSLPAPEDAEPWDERFLAKIDRKIAMYESCPLQYDRGELLITFLKENRHLLSDRPQTYQHGDYHIGNMMLDRKGVLTIIDFERDDYGDPWEEFNRIVWSAQAAPAFAAGMVDGYFDREVPMAFWKLLALYICSNSIGSLPWAIPFGETEIQTMKKQAALILQWYADMTDPVPSWYRENNN